MNQLDGCPTDGPMGLVVLLVKSGDMAQTRVNDALAAIELTFVKWRTLDALVRQDAPVSLGHLAAQLGCVKSNVTQLSDRMAAEGMVRRAGDPVDRRSVVIELTAKGRRLHGEAEKAMMLTVRGLLAALPEKDRAEFRRLLSRLQMQD